MSKRQNPPAEGRTSKIRQDGRNQRDTVSVQEDDRLFHNNFSFDLPGGSDNKDLPTVQKTLV